MNWSARLQGLRRLWSWAWNKQLVTEFSREVEYTELNSTRKLIWKWHRDGLVRRILVWVKYKCKIYNSTIFFFCLKLWWMTSDIIVLFSLIDSLYSGYLECICLVSITNLKGNVSKFRYLFLWPNCIIMNCRRFDQILKVFNKNDIYLKYITWWFDICI